MGKLYQAERAKWTKYQTETRLKSWTVEQIPVGQYGWNINNSGFWRKDGEDEDDRLSKTRP